MPGAGSALMRASDVAELRLPPKMRALLQLALQRRPLSSQLLRSIRPSSCRRLIRSHLKSGLEDPAGLWYSDEQLCEEPQRPHYAAAFKSRPRCGSCSRHPSSWRDRLIWRPAAPVRYGRSPLGAGNRFPSRAEYDPAQLQYPGSRRDPRAPCRRGKLPGRRGT